MKTLRMNNWLLALAATTVAAMVFVAPAAHAATSDPDDLVNTEAMFTIAPGDGAEDIELQFGTDAADRLLMFDFLQDRFEFGNDLFVNGGLEVQGDIDQNGNTLTLDADNAAAGADVDIVAEQGTDADGTLRYNATTNEWEISNDGGAFNSITTSNDIDNLTGVDSNTFTLDQDDTTGDVILQFGNLLAESLKWDETNTRFVLSETLLIEGGLILQDDLDFGGNEAVNMLLHQGTAFPTVPAPAEGQTFYRTDTDTMYIYDGSSWIPMADAPGGLSLFFAAQYPNATYHNDGLTNVGRLSYDFDSGNIENYYRWATRKTAMQDYDIKLRVQLPQDFSAWDTTPIEFDYRTNTANTADNAIDFQLDDSAGTSSASSTGLASVAWATDTPAVTAGTFSAGDWVTVTVKLYATNGDWADAGNLILNYLR